MGTKRIATSGNARVKMSGPGLKTAGRENPRLEVRHQKKYLLVYLVLCKLSSSFQCLYFYTKPRLKILDYLRVSPKNRINQSKDGHIKRINLFSEKMNKAENQFLPVPDLIRKRKLYGEREPAENLIKNKFTPKKMKIENKWKQWVLVGFLGILIIEIGLAIYLSTTWKNKDKVYVATPDGRKSETSGVYLRAAVSADSGKGSEFLVCTIRISLAEILCAISGDIFIGSSLKDIKIFKTIKN